MGNLGTPDGARDLGATPKAELRGLAAARAEVERVDAALAEAEDAVRRWIDSQRDPAATGGTER